MTYNFHSFEDQKLNLSHCSLNILTSAHDYYSHDEKVVMSVRWTNKALDDLDYFLDAFMSLKKKICVCVSQKKIITTVDQHWTYLR